MVALNNLPLHFQILSYASNIIRVPINVKFCLHCSDSYEAKANRFNTKFEFISFFKSTSGYSARTKYVIATVQWNFIGRDIRNLFYLELHFPYNSLITPNGKPKIRLIYSCIPYRSLCLCLNIKVLPTNFRQFSLPLGIVGES